MIGVGVDLVHISRIESVLGSQGARFAKRILSAAEYLQFDQIAESKRQALFMAKRFAIKEAVSKALGTGMSHGVSWQDIELHHDPLGKPEVSLKGGALARFNALKASKVLVSLSDETDLVTAYAHLA